MTTRLVHRPARTLPPLGVVDPLVISAPPVLPEGRGGHGLASLVPLAGSGVAMSMMMFLRGSGFAALGAIILVVSLGAAAGLYVTQRGQAGRKRRAQRGLYVTYLEGLRDDLRGAERSFRHDSLRRDPPATHLLDVVADPARLWERRRSDVDFLRLRAGTGERDVVRRVQRCWTSRSPPSSAWGRTGSAWAPLARARASCCARWSSRSPRPIRRRISRSCSSTTRVGRRSRRSHRCRRSRA